MGDSSDRRTVDWLLEEDEPSVRHRAMVDLLDRSEDDSEVRRARSRIGRVGWAASLLARQKPEGYWEARPPATWRGYARFLQFPMYASTMWPALVLSDLGMTRTDPRIAKTAEQIFQYKLRLSSPFNFFTEEVCAVGHTARMMTRFGYGADRRVQKLYAWMLEDQRENGGWNCTPDSPGVIDGWEAMAAFAAVPKTKRSRAMQRAIERGVEFYLARSLFREGKRYEPWFRFHYPTHSFYDILVGLDLITSLGDASDRRLRPALQVLAEKRRPDGSWLMEKVHPDVGPKERKDYAAKEIRSWSLERPGRPSKWLTLTALRVLKRVGEAS